MTDHQGKQLDPVKTSDLLTILTIGLLQMIALGVIVTRVAHHWWTWWLAGAFYLVGIPWMILRERRLLANENVSHARLAGERRRRRSGIMPTHWNYRIWEPFLVASTSHVGAVREDDPITITRPHFGQRLTHPQDHFWRTGRWSAYYAARLPQD